MKISHLVTKRKPFDPEAESIEPNQPKYSFSVIVPVYKLVSLFNKLFKRG